MIPDKLTGIIENQPPGRSVNRPGKKEKFKKVVATQCVVNYIIRSARQYIIRRINMPNINVQMGPATEEVKKKLIEELTSTAVRITSMRPEQFIVFIQETPYENIGVGGKTVKEIIGGK